MISALGLLAMAITATAQRPATARPTTKGIWEPVNYSEDLKLNDVFFVTPDVGWVAGDAGTILQTTDGGGHWTAQLGGDPQSGERPITNLQFLDDQHGWATQGNDLLRTTDGENWRKVGAFSYEWGDYAFTTFETGVYVRKDQIYRSTDGGRTWKQVFTCRLKVAVQGLARDVGCTITRVQFPTTEVGYAVSSYVGEKGQFALLKTLDGGATWAASIVRDVPVEYNNEVFFVDENRGLVAVNGTVQLTQDGGQTWSGVVGSVGYDFRFADPEVGWSITPVNLLRQHLAFTTDGGRRWTVRQLTFPATVHGFSVPRRDRAFVVGEHGMIYRYRVVAASEPTGANVLAAPAMPVFESPLDDDVETVDEQVDALEQQIDTAAAARATDTAGAFVDACCAQSVNKLQASIDGLTPLVPQFLAKYRNVNLIVAGLQLLGVLPDHVARLKEALKRLRAARGSAAATAALQELNAAVDGLSASTRQAFQQEPISMDAAATTESGTPPPEASVVAPAESSAGDSGAVRRRAEDEARRRLQEAKRRVRIRIP